jgi:P-type E1-E2 ATPase
MTYLSDRKANSYKVTVIRNGQEVQIKTGSIKVGDLVKVEKGQPFPADLLLLNTSYEDGICYVETSSLDGFVNVLILIVSESGLKLKTALQQTSHIKRVEELCKIGGEIRCE